MKWAGVMAVMAVTWWCLYCFFFHTGAWIEHARTPVERMGGRLGLGAVERHLVSTTDGFVLEMHRLLPTGEVTGARPIVWLQHGLFEDSLVWLLAGGNRSLPARLLAAGAEVWLGNNRGNAFSSHRQLAAEEASFWTDWSFHEMAVHDWPAQLRHVLDTAGTERLVYVGQSQGAVQALIALAVDAEAAAPRWARHVSRFVALAPGGFVQVPSNPCIRFLFDHISSGLFGSARFALTFDFWRYWTLLGHMGETLMGALGFISGDVDDALRGELYRHIPSGSTSIRNMEHWVQVANSGRLCPFNSSSPYPLRKIATPISMYLAGDDNIIDIEKSVREIPHHCLHIQPGFSHADFVWTGGPIFDQILDDILSTPTTQL